MSNRLYAALLPIALLIVGGNLIRLDTADVCMAGQDNEPTCVFVEPDFSDCKPVGEFVLDCRPNTHRDAAPERGAFGDRFVARLSE